MSSAADAKASLNFYMLRASNLFVTSRNDVRIELLTRYSALGQLCARRIPYRVLLSVYGLIHLPVTTILLTTFFNIVFQKE